MIPKISNYLEQFQTRAFGLFVHYGPYVQYNNGEWAMKLRNHDPEVYAEKALAYDYSAFNAEHVVEGAKLSGAKYIVFTTRHHDGFSMYDTRGLSDYDIMHTPNGRDIVKEFIDACHKFDVMPFLYHTTLDWHHPDFMDRFEDYETYLCASIEILCKNYGEIGGFWLDGNWSRKDKKWNLDDLYGTIRKYQPNAVLINNTGLSTPGVFGHKEIDCVTYEQGIPRKLNLEGMEKHYIGELCYPICEHWGIANDINVKSMKSILESFLSARKVGGNFLLGIFTDETGAQPMLHKGYLEALGSWVKTNQAALFGPTPSTVEGFQKDFVLQKDNKIYLFVHDVISWGDSNVKKMKAQNYSAFKNFPAGTKLKGGHWLDNQESVTHYFEADAGVLFIEPAPFQYGDSQIVRVAEFEIES
ncbi:MAG: alpha-L-fucosidase [Erysipelotrichaceae bacterium]